MARRHVLPLGPAHQRHPASLVDRGFPVLTERERLARFEVPEGRLRVVIDTDTYNEIDDQFALVYALFSPDRIGLEAIYAAPFTNDRAADPTT